MFDRIWKNIKEIATIVMKAFIDTNVRIILGFIPSMFVSRDLEKMLEKITENIGENKSSLDSKIEEARTALTQTSSIINELEIELMKNIENLESVKQDYKKFSKLAQVEKDSAATILENVQDTLRSGKRTERWISVFIGIGTGLFIFIIGIWLGPFITNLFNIGK